MQKKEELHQIHPEKTLKPQRPLHYSDNAS